MNNKFDAKIITIGTSEGITIPAELRESLGLNKGDLVRVRLEKLIVRPASEVTA